jgi:hypothetical protein
MAPVAVTVFVPRPTVQLGTAAYPLASVVTTRVVGLEGVQGFAKQPPPAVMENVTGMFAIPGPVGLAAVNWAGVTTRTLGAGTVPPSGATLEVAELAVMKPRVSTAPKGLRVLVVPVVPVEDARA